jgi:peptide methionine sulfoxide reductase msrA/msrB
MQDFFYKKEVWVLQETRVKGYKSFTSTAIFYIIKVMKAHTNLKYVLIGLFLATIWGYAYISVQHALDHNMNSYSIIFYRMLIPGVLAIPLLIKNWKYMNWGTLKAGLIMGVFLFLGYFFQTEGQQLASVSVASFLTVVNVIFVPFICLILFKHKITANNLIAVFLCAIGVGLLTLKGSIVLHEGEILLLLCAFTFAIQISLIPHYVRKYNYVLLTIIQIYLLVILSFFLALFQHSPLDLGDNPTDIILDLFIIGVLSTGLGLLVQTKIAEKLSAVVSSVIFSLECVTGTFFSVWLLNEKFEIKMVFGAILIFMAIIVAQTDFSKLFKKKETNMEKIYFAGGCFWGVQHYFDFIDGVASTQVGYANGKTANPKYEDVKAQKTGHAETVLVEFDSSIISLETLIDAFFLIIDPTSLNKQGHDEGIQYRSGIYYINEDQHRIIDAAVTELQKKTEGTIVIEVLPLEHFYDAETYHQKYLVKNPSGYCHLNKTHFDKAKKINK